MRVNRPSPLSLLEVKFEVYSKENADRLASRIEETPLICVTPQNYGNLGNNFSEIERYILDLQSWGWANERLYLDEDPVEQP